jgi:hypothetical protein
MVNYPQSGLDFLDEKIDPASIGSLGCSQHRAIHTNSVAKQNHAADVLG